MTEFDDTKKIAKADQKSGDKTKTSQTTEKREVRNPCNFKFEPSQIELCRQQNAKLDGRTRTVVETKNNQENKPIIQVRNPDLRERFVKIPVEDSKPVTVKKPEPKVIIVGRTDRSKAL